MLRRLRWVAIGIAALIGAYALAGAALSSRFDRKMAAFRASEAYADLERRTADIPADENAVSLFADAAAALARLQEKHETYAYAWAWEPDDLEKICAPPGEEGFDPYDRQREEMKSALIALEPFVAAFAVALERPAVQQPVDWYAPGDEAFTLLTNMLPFRARLLPERAPESGDLLLRLGTKWRAREMSDVIHRHAVVREALRIVRDILARDPLQAAPYFDAWRERIAAEDPIALFRLHWASALSSTGDTVEMVRRGEDPYGDKRWFFEALHLPVEPRWTFRWYGRPFFYWKVIGEVDSLNGMIEMAETEAGLRDLLRRPGTERVTAIVGVRMLEEIALLRLSRAAMAAADGEPLPELENPFTGLPLLVRRAEGAVMIEAELPEAFRDRVETRGLLVWEVRR